MKRSEINQPCREVLACILRHGWALPRTPGIWHAFPPSSDDCSVGDVSTANDDLHDHVFVGRVPGTFPQSEDDKPAQISLLSA